MIAALVMIANLAPVPYSALKAGSPPAATAPAAASAPATAKPAPVISPVWLNGPTQSLIQSCMDGYLKDKTFTGEPFIMACTVQKDGTLDGCLVQESKRAQAAGLHDVAVCSAAGFRMGPVDTLGQPTAGRPVKIPMGITPTANVANASPATAPAQTPPSKTPATTPPKKP